MRSGWLVAAVLLLSLGLRLWGIQDRLPDPSHGVNLMADTSLDETDRTTMSEAWSMWAGGSRPLDLNPHTAGWPALSFYVALLFQVSYRILFTIQTGSSSAFEFARHVAIAPAGMFLFARVASALLGVATVFLTIRIGASVLGPVAGLAAGLLLATNPLHVLTSQHAADPNLLALLFVLLAIPPLLRIAETAAPRDSVLAGAMIGLAGACKYVPLVLLLPYLVAHVVSRDRSGRTWTTAVAGAGVALLTMLLATPYLVRDWPATLHDFSVQHASVTSEWVGQGSNGIALSRYLVSTLPEALGWPAAILALAGCIILVTRGIRERLLVGIALVLLAAVGILQVAQARYVLAAFPTFFIATAAATEAASRWTARWMARLEAGPVAFALLLVPAVGWGFPELRETRRALSMPDSRIAAREWILQSIPPRDILVVDPYGPSFNSSGFERPALPWPFYATRASLVEAAYHPEWLDGIAYYVRSAEVSRRFESDPAHYPVQVAFYRWLRQNGESVWKSDTVRCSGPSIEVLRLPPAIGTPAARDSLWSTVLPTIQLRDPIARWCLVLSEVFDLNGDPRAIEWGERGLTVVTPQTARGLYATLALAQAKAAAPGAEGTARRGLAEFPNDPTLHLAFGMVLDQAGLVPGAIEEYRASLRLDPNQDHAANIAARIRSLEQEPSRP